MNQMEVGEREAPLPEISVWGLSWGGGWWGVRVRVNGSFRALSNFLVCLIGRHHRDEDNGLCFQPTLSKYFEATRCVGRLVVPAAGCQ